MSQSVDANEPTLRQPSYQKSWKKWERQSEQETAREKGDTERYSCLQQSESYCLLCNC